MGGDANLSVHSIVKRNNSEEFEIADPSNYWNLDTGLYDQSNSRQVKKFFGNSTILQRRKYYSAGNLVYYFVNPWDNYQTVGILKILTFFFTGQIFNDF